MDVMLSLGPIIFSIAGPAYDEFVRTTTYRWVQQDRLIRRPAHSWIGIGSDDISLNGVIHPQFNPLGAGVIGTRVIDRLRSFAEEGIPLLLITGRGDNMGRYVIKTIREKATVFFQNGAPRLQEFSMEISRYGEDEIGEKSIIFDGDGFKEQRIEDNIDLPQRAVA